MVYYPRFQKQLRADDPRGALNCTCYSGAMAGDYHTLGKKRPTGESVRILTGDKSGGTTLNQVDLSLNKGWLINLDTRVGSSKLTWNQFAARINAGQGAILQGAYSAINKTRYSGSPTFTGNHAIFIAPKWVGMDPLCDGRRPGIYKYHGEPYPQSMLKDFAGRLVLDPRRAKRLGYGYVWASFTKDNVTTPKPVPPGTWNYKVRVPETVFIRYYTKKGVIYKMTKHKTRGFSAYCTDPHTFPAHSSMPFNSRNLVWVKSGSYNGWLISSRYAQEI